LTGVSSPIVVPAAEQRRLCPSRNGLRDGDICAQNRDFLRSFKLIVYEEGRTWLSAGRQSLTCLLWFGPAGRELMKTLMEFERRSITRTTISKDALLFFDEQRGVFTCRVQDVTNVGAGIELHSLNLLPPDFELSFDNFHTIRECRVIWRQGDFVGVAFQN
jgi:hypothetical protein